MGYRGLTALTPTYAQDFIDRADVILAADFMHQMTGVEFTRQLRSQQIYTPVIIYTTNLLYEHADAFTSQGVNEVLSKPLSKAKLFNAVRKVINEEYLD
jgi:CheY-like chemotaxis protein